MTESEFIELVDLGMTAINAASYEVEAAAVNFQSRLRAALEKDPEILAIVSKLEKKPLDDESYVAFANKLLKNAKAKGDAELALAKLLNVVFATQILYIKKSDVKEFNELRRLGINAVAAQLLIEDAARNKSDLKLYDWHHLAIQIAKFKFRLISDFVINQNAMDILCLQAKTRGISLDDCMSNMAANILLQAVVAKDSEASLIESFNSIFNTKLEEVSKTYLLMSFFSKFTVPNTPAVSQIGKSPEMTKQPNRC